MTNISSALSPALAGHGAVAVPVALSHVRGDRLVGALFSLSLIAGGAWLGGLAKSRRSLPAATPAAAVNLMVMPWIETEQPDEAVPREIIRPNEVRPPVQPDVPSLPNPDNFVQPFEPPPPGVPIINGGLATLPPDAGPVDTGKIFDLAQLDRQPVPVSQSRPVYPFEMRRNGVSGQVVVDFIVDAAGRVRSPAAASSTNQNFEQAAVDAVAKWRFQPGRKAGRDVRTHMQVPIVFSLHTDE